MTIMYSKATVAGHPIHPMLVAFPVTFYTTTLFAFSAFAATDNSFWWRLGLGMNLAGVIAAVIAAVPGFIDWATGIVANTPAKATGLKHMLLNWGALALFLVNYLMQRGTWEAKSDTAFDPSLPIILCGIGFVLTLIAGFLGWKLVQTHHVGVELNDDQRRHEPMLREATGRPRGT